MPQAKVLFADNDEDYLNATAKLLEKEGYRVFKANTPAHARQLLQRGEVDAAILDLRLRDNEDKHDKSGLRIAEEVAKTIPKIILTDYPTDDDMQAALGPDLDGLPPALEFVKKIEGFDTLHEALVCSLGPGKKWLDDVWKSSQITDEQLNKDYNDARTQAKTSFWASLGVSIVGVIVVFAGIGMVFAGYVAVGAVSATAGIVGELLSLLFFKRADAANRRMDQLRLQRLEGQRFDTLLHAAEGFDSEQNQEKARELIIFSAVSRWLAKPGTTDSLEQDRSNPPNQLSSGMSE